MSEEAKNEEIKEQTDDTVKEAKEAKTEKPEKEKKSKDSKKVSELEEKIESLEKQLAETKDMLLRTAAEYDNFKKRETANREKSANFVKGDTIKALLPSIDNISRAMAADESSPEYAKGVAMTIKGLTDALKKLGLEEINPVNEPFDVNLHQAVMRVEDDSVGENIVVEVLQTGYKLGDNVLRHAMVKVANCD
ncbi:MAG: nucleotide exchange factor GrpE [Acutalibacteraceae bacterium]|nr:nucleotide exchange factor GrpE [Acutalibacteraceae bacterium]